MHMAEFYFITNKNKIKFNHLLKSKWKWGLSKAKCKWLVMPVSIALGRLRQEDRCDLKASLGYRVRPYLNETEQTNKNEQEDK